MMMTLPDTRPYPTDPVKNDLLLYAEQIARPTSGAQRKLAQEHLTAQLHALLSQRQILSLSVAMSMAPDRETHVALADGLADVLDALPASGEAQWFALPVVLVCGAEQAMPLAADAPVAALQNLLAQYPHLQPLATAQWLPQLVSGEDFAAVRADRWFAAKTQADAAALKLSPRPVSAAAGKSVQVLYALAWGDASLRPLLGKPLAQAALPLMQLWQQHFAQTGLTVFANPLTALPPLTALAQAAHMRLRMALDVFAADALRALRLQNRPVAAVAAAQEGGRLLFGFADAEDAVNAPHTFVWTLSPRDNIATVQQDFLELMHDCHVHDICLLPRPLPEHAVLPNYVQAQQLKTRQDWLN
ncbi:hypothetical protein [Conchiformibius kuhniae]|uniref:Conjugal transfer protein n=1 Tax=Conchiformibius kuhniae TaxID=211502 RepID=A0A8T9MYQ2_9NEIS|nr:hypothetical protein [Conchiformibius kuhniae]